jgi:peptidoglycan/xylan/chitin deacetylase (PgdA/CDA1 family)
MDDRSRTTRRLTAAAKAGLTRSRSARWWAGRRLGRGGRRAAGLRVLFYHRVAEEREPLAVTPGDFRRQMDHLARTGRPVVDLHAGWRALRDGSLPDGAVALTFDDGYRDFLEHASPVLDAHGFPSTVFVCPGFVDGTARPAWYERPPPMLDWEDIGALAARGVTFAPHTMSHPDLRTLGPEPMLREIAESRRVLERRLARPMPSFCYPAGFADDAVRDAVRRAGFELAVSCEPGLNDAATDPHWLRRVELGGADRFLDFRAKVDGAHDHALPGRALYRRVRFGA